jgi:hypothetical protein
MATPTKPVEPKPAPVKSVEGSNSDPTKVGGMQPIYCPQCKEEVKAQDSYHLSLDNKRYHYPVCWQHKELGIG